MPREKIKFAGGAANKFLPEYFATKIEKMLDEAFPAEEYKEEKFPNLDRMKADYVAEYHEKIYAELMNSFPEFEEAVSKEQVDELGRQTNPDYRPLSDEEVMNREVNGQYTLAAMSDAYIKHAIASYSLKYGKRLTRTEECLLDFSGSEESFEKNRKIKEKLQGTPTERVDIYAERLRELLQTDVSGIDLADDSKLPENLQKLGDIFSSGSELINLAENIVKLGADFETREEFNEFAARMNYLGTMGYIARIKTDIITSPTYHYANLEDTKVNLGGALINGEEVSLSSALNTEDSMITAPYDQNYILNFNTIGDRGFQALLNDKLSPEEREEQYYRTFDIKYTEYKELNPIIEEESNELMAEFLRDLDSVGNEPGELDINNPKNNAPEKMQELTFKREDGTVDKYKEDLPKIREKLLSNIEKLKKVKPDLVMSEEEINAHLSPERYALYEKALAAKEKLDLMNHHKGITGEFEFPGNSYSAGRYLLDVSGTPEAKEHNAKVMRAFDRSRENLEDKAEIFAEALNRMTALEPKKFLPPTDLMERMEYIVDHASDFMLAWGFRRGLTDRDVLNNKLGVKLTPEQADLVNKVGATAESFGGLKGLLDFAASGQFITVPYEKLSRDNLLTAVSERSVAMNDINTVLTFEEKYVPEYEDISGIVFDKDYQRGPFEVSEAIYGDIPLNDITAVREGVEELSARLAALGDKASGMPDSFKQLKEKLTALNEAFREADTGGIVTPEAAEKLTGAMKPLEDDLGLFRKNIEKQKGESELTECCHELGMLLNDFGTYGPDFKSRIRKINDIARKEEYTLDAFERINDIATYTATVDWQYAPDDALNLVDDCFQWGLTPFSINGSDYSKMKDFIDALINWKVENTLELGEQAWYLKDKMGISDDKAAYFAQEYSLPGKKSRGIQDAMGLMKVADDSYFYKMCEIYDIELSDNVGNLVQYVGYKAKNALQEKLASLDGKDREKLLLGMKANDTNIPVPEFSGREGRFLEGYAKEQQELRAARLPGEFNMPNSRDYISNVKSVAKIGEQLLDIDETLHKNSKTYNDLKGAIQRLSEASKGLETDRINDLDLVALDDTIKAIEDIKKHAEEYLSSKWKGRRSDLGKARFDKVSELLSAVAPERADMVENKLNITRVINGREKITLKRAEPHQRQSRELPEVPTGSWVKSPQKIVEESMKICERDLKEISQTPGINKSDELKASLATLILGNIVEINPAKNNYYSVIKFKNDVKKVAATKEFAQTLANSGITQDNLKTHLNSKSLGARLAKDYMFRCAKSAAKLDAEETRLSRQRSKDDSHVQQQKKPIEMNIPGKS